MTDKPPEYSVGVQSDFYIDRPPTPLFVPVKLGDDAGTQIEEGELFDFDVEIEPMLNTLCMRMVESARMEVLEEEELQIMRD